MTVGKFDSFWKAKRSRDFHSSGGITHWISEKPGDPYRYHVLNAVPWPYDAAEVGWPELVTA